MRCAISAKTVLLIMVAAVAVQMAYALVPPVNVWGYAFTDGKPAPDGTRITIKGNCYNNGQQTISETTTQYGNGYYDTNIPMDSPTTTQDEGCQTGQTVTIYVGNKEVAKLQLPSGGYSFQLDLESEAGALEESPASESSSGGGGSGGGGMSGAPVPSESSEKDERAGDEIEKTADKVVVIEERNPSLVPPVNVWGYAFTDGKPAPDGTRITIKGNCYNNGQQTISETTTQYGNGYYDTNIPMDSPTTTQDEGCQTGQTVTIYVAGAEKMVLTLPDAGSSIKVVLGEEKKERKAELEEPAKIGSKESRIREMMLVTALVLLGALLWAVIYGKHKRIEGAQ